MKQISSNCWQEKTFAIFKFSITILSVFLQKQLEKTVELITNSRCIERRELKNPG